MSSPSNWCHRILGAIQLKKAVDRANSLIIPSQVDRASVILFLLFPENCMWKAGSRTRFSEFVVKSRSPEACVLAGMVTVGIGSPRHESAEETAAGVTV
jgi:hypothetical protein